MLQVATITDEPEFVAMQSAWNAVARQADPNNVFLSHEWFNAAWAWRRLDSTLNLLVARAGDRLVGILPLIRGRNQRRMELLTVPDTQFADVIASPADGRAVAEAFATRLAARDWDTLHLDYLRAKSSTLRDLVPALAQHHLCFEDRDGGHNPYVELSGSWDAFYTGRSRSLKKANNLAANRLSKTGEIRVEWLGPGAGDAECQRVLETAIAISARSWKKETGNALDQPGPNAFIRELSRSGFKNGWLSIWLVHVASRPLAMEYQLICAGNVHALRADFDIECEAVSPGTYLFRHLLESLFERKLERYFMGPGENPYKKRWTDQAEPLRRIVIYNRTCRGRAAWIREVVVKPRLRHLRDRFQGGPQSDHREGSLA
jgi:CelD/BcsL family acetyltransferase involved in cellulose biosynthesis